MLTGEQNLCIRVTIAGVIWKFTGDPAFVDCLNEKDALKLAYTHQICWLDDERAIDFLIDKLEAEDGFARSLTLSFLNELELGRRMMVPGHQLPRQLDDYRSRRHDPAFREQMTEALRKHNRRAKHWC